MPVATDTYRIAKAHTPLGSKLVFRQISGREEISRLFEYRLEVLAEDDSSVDPKALLGQPIVVEIMIQGGGSRYVNAECVRFAYVGTEYSKERNTTLWRYEATLRPWVWYMTRTATCKIFQNKTVPDILYEVLGKYPFQIKPSLSKPYRSWDYCVQYQETDFNFVSRLMEHEGIYFWFEHSMGSCTMVLADDIGAHQVLPGYASIPHIPPDMMTKPDEEYIDHWQMAQEVDSGGYFTDDYYYRTPSADLKVKREKSLPFPHGSYEIYDWPGGYTEPQPWGDQYAQTRIEELQQSKELTFCQSNARGLAPGYLFTLEKCPRRDQNRQYLIRSVNTFMRDNPYTTGGVGPADWQFVVEAQPVDVPYRPQRLTPKPRITGPQTAVVTGPKDEEIFTEELGRVKVHFYWDRDQPADENSSCWIRVGSSWAGSNWGQISLPRIGQEVIVEFIDGDPDYPIITGRVYNYEHKPPYELPKYKEYSTIKSHSTKKGGTMDWNELRFYDWKGKEQVFIHCNWRMDVRVKWNKYLTVKESYHILVGHSYYRTVGGNTNLYTYGGLKERVDGKVEKSVGGTYGLIVEGAAAAVIKAEASLSAPSIILEAKNKISLKVGGNSIVIDNSGVTIAGTMVKINSGGFGTEAKDVDMDDPPYASESDNGEPGYLDRPKKGGGWKPKRRHAGAYHGASVSPPGESPAVAAMRERLSQTPTGRHALDVYDKDGVKTTFLPNQGSSYSGSKFKDNTMNLDPAVPGDGNDAGFVHEMNHAQEDHEGNSVFGKEKSTEKEAYKTGMLNEEAAGMAKEAQYANEQAAKGTPMSNPPPYQTNYNNNYQSGVQAEQAKNPNATAEELDAAGKKAGTAAMKKDLEDGTYVASTNGQKYPDYYGDIHTNDNK